MTTIPTNNPVPSDHPADARDNFKRIDEVVNLRANQTGLTRTGKNLDTILGVYRKMGGVNVGDYQNGTVLREPYDYVLNTSNNTRWRIKSISSLPYTIDATENPDPANDSNLVIWSDINSDSLSDFTSIAFDTVADMISGTTRNGTITHQLGNQYTVSGTGYKVVGFVAEVNLGGGLYAHKVNIPSVLSFDLPMQPGVDIGPALNAALSSVPNGGTYVIPRANHSYTLNTTVTIPQNVTLDVNYQSITFGNANQYAFILGGDGVNALLYRANLINFRLILSDQNANGVHALGVTQSDVKGYIEGPFSDFTTRTNIGLFVDGGNVSNFGNNFEIVTNHVHESIRIGTTGTTQTTANYFLNCYLFGDFSSGDITSIGYHFQDSTVGAYDGTVISGGNVEQTNTNIRFGNNARGISVDTRFETPATGTARKLVYGTGTSGIKCRIAGIDLVVVGDIAGGIVGFDNTRNSIEDANGNTRENGNTGSFIGLVSNPIKATGHVTELHRPNQNILDLMNTQDTGTGSFLRQPGRGSIAWGAYYRIYAPQHASRPGQFDCGPSMGVGNFNVTRGFGGSVVFVVNGDGTAARPGSDNLSSSGQASYRWTQVYATNTTINPSDARLKTEVKGISDSEYKAGLQILKSLGGWKWLDKVEKEGDDARIHYGPTVQAVMKAFKDNGIDPFSRSLVCYDKWEDQYDTRLKKIAYTDDDGIEHEDEFEEVLTKKAGDIYSLRKEELSMFLLAVNDIRMTKIEEKLNSL